MEEKERTPHYKRQREITPLQEQNIIKLRKKYIRRSARKLVFDYQRIYRERISSWKIQKVIEKYKLYYHPEKRAKRARKRKRTLKEKRITQLKKKNKTRFLICLDVIVLYLQGVKRYIFTALDHYSKIAWIYQSESSQNAQDFFRRAHEVLDYQNYQTPIEFASHNANPHLVHLIEKLKILE